MAKIVPAQSRVVPAEKPALEAEAVTWLIVVPLSVLKLVTKVSWLVIANPTIQTAIPIQTTAKLIIMYRATRRVPSNIRPANRTVSTVAIRNWVNGSGFQVKPATYPRLGTSNVIMVVKLNEIQVVKTNVS